MVMDLRLTHDRVGSRTDPTLNGHFRYPNKLHQSLNDTTPEKIRKYRPDYNNNPPNTIVFMYTLFLLFLVRLGGYIVNLSNFYSYRLIGKLTTFLQLQEFSLSKHIVTSSTTAARLSLPISKTKLV